jgi:hypothetical protein
MDQRHTSKERLRSSIFLGATYLLNRLVSFGKMLMASVIVAILLLSITILYALSDMDLSPFANEKIQPPISNDTHKIDCFFSLNNCASD